MSKITKYIISLILINVLLFSVSSAKTADLAGQWYPASPTDLKKMLQGYLENAETSAIRGKILGAIVPHAGFRYSGSIAACSYKAIAKNKPDIAIVIGFTHRIHYPGKISVFTDKYFATPLGKALIDPAITKKLLDFNENIQDIPAAFDNENSIEMQVPFLQVSLPETKLVLVAITDQRIDTCKILSDALMSIIKENDNVALIASADMCHYLNYKAANQQDAGTIKMIKKIDPLKFYKESIMDSNNERMCGFGAVFTVMETSKRLGANTVSVLKYANSGDTAGSKNRVVGYMSALFEKADKTEISAKPKIKFNKETHMFNKKQRKELLRLARNTIKHYLTTGKVIEPEISDPALKKDMGAFVTLHKNENLRGCIGDMAATGPLYLAVRDMAIAAATEDPRFPKLSISELDDIDIEISVLTPMKKIDDYNIIEMGKHGVLVRMGGRSGVYLPQVADETGWDRDQFLSSLCAHKAGIPQNAWKTGDCDIYVFTAEVFGEKDSDN